MFANGDIMVFSHQQMQDINIIFSALRAVDEEACGRPLAQRIIYIFRIIREHPECAIPAHNRICARKAFHQHSGDFKLSRRGLTVAAFPRELINIVNRAKTNDIGVDDLIDKGFGVLRRFALIAINTIRAEVSVTEGISRVITIIIEEACHHLNQRCLTRTGRTVAHESEDKSA